MPKSVKQCEEIKKQMREKILKKSALYFAKNGYAGTKISDLAKYIGIGQGTMYLYFQSKEELFHAILDLSTQSSEIKKVKLLAALPIPAVKKIQRISDNVLQQLMISEDFAGMIAISTQMLLEKSKEASSYDSTYQSELYQDMKKIIIQGQKEGTIVEGDPLKLVDYYWGVIYLYSLKRMFTTEFEMISSEDLNRTVFKK